MIKCTEGEEEAFVADGEVPGLLPTGFTEGEQGGGCEMLCERPFYRVAGGVSLKDRITKEDARLHGTPLPCGRCIPCRVNKSRVWTHRILLESMLYPSNTFLTLTYEDKFIPDGSTLVKTEISDYVKRLRRYVEPFKIRYFGVGEYGKQHNRPHYHLMLFGIGPNNEKLFQKAWEKGFIQTGDVNEKTAKYVTGYIMKDWVDSKVIALGDREPEFMRCSRNPGIGREAIKKVANNYVAHEYHEVKDITELNYGKKAMPMGRYLHDKFMEDAGSGKDVSCLTLYDYQEELFEKHGEKEFLKNFMKENEESIKSLKKRQKIYSQRRSL